MSFQPEQVSILKRLAQSIFQRDGVIRKLENIGDKPLPHKISNHGNAHRRGSYFLFNFDLPPTSIEVKLENHYIINNINFIISKLVELHIGIYLY